MKIFNKLITILLIFSLVLPMLAQARAGSRVGGGSFRSSGGFGGGGYRSYQGSTGGYRSQPAYGGYQQRQSAAAYPQRSTGSFFSGVASGLLGAWLFNKVFNTNSNEGKQPATTATNPPTQQENGGFLRLLVLLAVAFFAWRYFKNRRKNQSKDSRFYQESRPNKINMNDFINLSKSNTSPTTLPLDQGDYRDFENILVTIQEAWGANDLTTLQTMTTAEIFNNFSQILQENKQKGFATHVSNVKLLNQTVEESWQEGSTRFARVRLTWSALDYVVNTALSSNDPGYLLEGNSQQPSTVTESWTFVKPENGPWLLSEVNPV